MKRALSAFAFALCTLAVSPRAKAAEPEAFARVVVDQAELRSGPGVSFRVIHVAERGDTLAIDGRVGTGFWLRVILDDGRTAYALGDQVQTFAVKPDAPDAPSRPGLFAPPPLEGARGGVAIVGGLWVAPVDGAGGERKGFGYMELRPSIVVHKTLSLDAFVGDAMTADGSQVLYGGGATIYFAPSWSLCPFANLSAGGLSVFPHGDSFVLRRRDDYVARAGGGLLLALRGRILVRFEATNVTLFTPDRFRNAQSYSGGFGVYF